MAERQPYCRRLRSREAAALSNACDCMVVCVNSSWSRKRNGKWPVKATDLFIAKFIVRFINDYSCWCSSGCQPSLHYALRRALKEEKSFCGVCDVYCVILKIWSGSRKEINRIWYETEQTTAVLCGRADNKDHRSLRLDARYDFFQRIFLILNQKLQASAIFESDLIYRLRRTKLNFLDLPNHQNQS